MDGLMNRLAKLSENKECRAMDDKIHSKSQW